MHRNALLPWPLTPILSSSLCYRGKKSNGTSLRLCTWKQRDSEVGTSRSLSPGISRSDRIKKGSRSTDLRLLLWKKLCQFRVPSEALKPYRSCEAQNPKSKRFYQQLEPTTKQNHTVTRSVARSGKLEEPVNMQTQNHN